MNVSHFTDKDYEVRRIKCLTKAIKLVSKGTGIPTKVYMAQISTFCILGWKLFLPFIILPFYILYVFANYTDFFNLCNITEEFEVKEKLYP